MSSYLTGGLKQLYQQISSSSTIPVYDYGEFTNINGHFKLHRDCIMASRYRVLKILNTEGQSAVLVQAEDLFCFKKLVVIKILHTELYQLGTQETHCMWRLSCNDPDGLSGTVKLLNVFTFDDHFCMVLEPLQSDPLTRIFHNVSREQLLPGIRKVALRLLSTLGFLRQHNVIHADLKPDNLLLKKTNELSSIKVVDFGNALHYVHKEVSLYYDDFEVQTPLYRAPEVMFGLPFGTEIDMWSLGCILAELYLGRHLFAGTTKQEILQEIVKLFGPFPSNLFQRGKFFQDQRHYTDNCVQPNGANALMKCPIKDYDFRSFLSGLLRYDPDERLTPFQAAQHRFLASEFPVGFLSPLPSGVTEAYPPVKITSSNYSYTPKISSDIKRSQPSSRDLLRIGTSSPELDNHDAKNGILCPRSHDFSKIAKVNPVQRTPSVMSEDTADVVSPGSGDYDNLSLTPSSVSAERGSNDNVHRPLIERDNIVFVDSRENNHMQQNLVSPGNDHQYNERQANDMLQEITISSVRGDNHILQRPVERLPVISSEGQDQNSSLIHSVETENEIENHGCRSRQVDRCNKCDSSQNEESNSILNISHRHNNSRTYDSPRTTSLSDRIELQNTLESENIEPLSNGIKQATQRGNNSDSHSDTSSYNELENIVNQNKTRNEQNPISGIVQNKSEQDQYLTNIPEKSQSESKLKFPCCKSDTETLQLRSDETKSGKNKCELPRRVPVRLNSQEKNSDGKVCSTLSQSPGFLLTVKEADEGISGRNVTENHKFQKKRFQIFKSARPSLSYSKTGTSKRYSDPLTKYSSSRYKMDISGQREACITENSDTSEWSCHVKISKTESENSKKRRKTSSASDLKSLMNQIRQEQDIVEQDLSNKEHDHQLRCVSPPSTKGQKDYTVGNIADNILSPVLAGAPDIKRSRIGSFEKKSDVQAKDNCSKIRRTTSCNSDILNHEENYFTKAVESEIGRSIKSGKEQGCTKSLFNRRIRDKKKNDSSKKKVSTQSSKMKSQNMDEFDKETSPVKNPVIEGDILSSCQKTSKNLSVKRKQSFPCETFNQSVVNTQQNTEIPVSVNQTLCCSAQNPTNEHLPVRKKQKHVLNARKRLPFSGPNTSTNIKNYLHVLKINKGSKKPRIGKNREVKKVKIKKVQKTENVFNNKDDPYSFIDTPAKSKHASSTTTSTMTKDDTKSSLHPGNTWISESNKKFISTEIHSDIVSSLNNEPSQTNTQEKEDFKFSSAREDMKTKSILNLRNSSMSESNHNLISPKSGIHNGSFTRKSVNKNRNMGERKQINNGLKCLKSVKKSRTPSQQELNNIHQETHSSTKKQYTGKKSEKFYFDSSPENTDKNERISQSVEKMKSKIDEAEGKKSKGLSEENNKYINVYPDSDDSTYSDYIHLCGSPATVGRISKEQKSVDSRHLFEEEDEIMLLQG